ncbi:RDD family protein [Haloarcula salinisoli]|uniref:RDD family protein n=1 Tax=Haloarcula salinisoli TaxID=2487746 RepID=A0A8J7YI19_9EURY|nr:RDD family protein [Halomicroarcula salinisoli]MBX0288271.1 RDD family protein [Halomicroarcula salinisoli]MBX0305932.1 RDD family protein [Halomicroarcula salinisoli]
MVGLQRLGLFGVIHMDDPTKVTAELHEFAGDAEALFIEFPDGGVSPWVWLSAALRTPAIFVGLLYFMSIFQGLVLLLVSRDLLPSELVAVRRVAADRDLPIHGVDENPVEAAATAGPKLAALNWAILLPVLVFEPVAAAVTVAAAVAGILAPFFLRGQGYRRLGPTLFALGLVGIVAIAVTGPFSLLLPVIGALSILVYMVYGIDHRNEVMLDRVAGIAGEEGYDEAVLVTGKGHLGGLARKAADRGLTVPRILVSFWRDDGETVTDIEPAALPEIEFGAGSNGLETTGMRNDTETRLHRALAAGIDYVAVGIVWVICNFVALLPLVVVTDATTSVALWTAVGSFCLLAVGYHVVLETVWGQTIGKRFAGLVVSGTDGSELDARTALVRNALRPLGMATLYLGSALVVNSTSRGQTMGDLLARTVVTRVANAPKSDGQDGDDEATEERPQSPRDDSPTSEVADATPDADSGPSRYW